MARRFSEKQIQARYQRMLVYQQNKIVFCPISVFRPSLDAKVNTQDIAQDSPYRRFIGELDEVYAARVCLGLCPTHHQFR